MCICVFKVESLHIDVFVLNLQFHGHRLNRSRFELFLKKVTHCSHFSKCELLALKANDKIIKI